MINIVVARLKSTRSFYYLLDNNVNVKKGDLIVIDSENGLQLAEVIAANMSEDEKNLSMPLKSVVRIANNDDITKYKKNCEDNLSVLNDSRKIASDLKLNINFVESYYNLDKSQLILSFLSDNRIDFRELAKKLAQKYKTRIELRQIGVRDKAKKIGGLGPCGLPLCCNTFLTDFNSVSINMAKNQMLALNPGKINGVCGRLLCCLAYENDAYFELKNNLPKVGMMADTKLGMGKVISIDILKQTYKVSLKDNGIMEFDINGEVK